MMKTLSLSKDGPRAEACPSMFLTGARGEGMRRRPGLAWFI